MMGKGKSGLMAAVAVAALVGSPAFAMGDRPPHHPRDDHGPVASAPEIDAGSGLASAAVLIAALCLAWERRRRAA
jgi:hypothetical protein